MLLEFDYVGNFRLGNCLSEIVSFVKFLDGKLSFRKLSIEILSSGKLSVGNCRCGKLLDEKLSWNQLT